MDFILISITILTVWIGAPFAIGFFIASFQAKDSLVRLKRRKIALWSLVPAISMFFSLAVLGLISFRSYRADFQTETYFPTLILSPYSVRVIAPSSVHVLPGKILLLEFQVSNVGTEKETFRLHLRNRLGWSVVGVIPDSVQLAARSSVIVPISIQIPIESDGSNNEVVLTAQSVKMELMTDSAETKIITNSPTHDTDGDGIPDVADNCPYTSNKDQADKNTNGIGDVCSNASQ